MPEATNYPQTRQQRLARKAFLCVQKRQKDEEYLGFAQPFPAIIHTCGLAQALAFTQAKKRKDLDHAPLLEDLAEVMGFDGPPDSRSERLLSEARQASVMEYLRLSREALTAADWLKRYAEALLEKPDSREPTEAATNAGPDRKGGA